MKALRLTLLFLSFLTINGCSKAPPTPQGARYSIKNDAPPTKPLNYKAKTLTPKAEPLSRYGNPSSYQVDGKTYQVSRSASGYKETGIASWYGTKFHKHSTSSGEKYNMYEMTAAHRTLPLPSYVRVKNLENGKTAIIRVNDRGPFHPNRILDLSYAAAKSLGILNKGTGKVEVEVIEDKQKQNQLAKYYIQAGAFESNKNARILKDKIKLLTPTAVRVQRINQKFIVLIGPLTTQSKTNTLKSKLAVEGVKPVMTFLN